MCSQFWQYHAGIRWPHQSWREMHQSWMLLSQWMYVFAHSSGTICVWPSRDRRDRRLGQRLHLARTTASRSSARPRCRERWHRGSVSMCGFAAAREALAPRAPSSPPCAPRSDRGPRTARRSRSACRRGSRMLISSSSWRLPVAKSLKSCAGVTFTAPVPNFGRPGSRR